MRPIVVNDHGGLVFFSATCGLKGAVETSTSGASVHSLLWDAGNSAVPFCITACTMEKFKKELKEALKLLGIVIISIPVFFAGLYGFASVMADIFDKPNTQTIEKPQKTLGDRRQEFASKLADELVATNNLELLRNWAFLHNIAIQDFSSAQTIREEIRRKSSNFAIYREEGILTPLIAFMMTSDSGKRSVEKVVSEFENTLNVKDL